jgi:predicted AAA+ superfamily ATPase
MLVSEKKLKKYYLSYPAFTYSLIEPHIQLDEGIIFEHLFVSLMDAKFFYRSTTKEEVDIIQTQGKILPVEIKYKANISMKDLRGIKSFIKRYDCKQGLVISKE